MDSVIRFSVSFLEWMFIVGLVGSAVTIMVTTVDDIKVLMDKDPTPQHHE
jgi:hypothetical protein